MRLTLAELADVGPREIGTTGWHTIDQAMIDAFATATGDRQWIHVDPRRAADSPFGTTVAHGHLVLALVPVLLAEVLELVDLRMCVNYGIDRLRFTAPVPAGSRVRLAARFEFTRRWGKDVLFKMRIALEVEGSSKPAFTGEVLYVAS
jgi:acyl dehydratase